MSRGVLSRVWRATVSLKTTAVLMVWFAEWLLVGIFTPQTRLVGIAEIAARAKASRVAEFLFVTLGLAELPTSPIFLGTLAVLGVHLVCVLVDRAGGVARRVRLRSVTGAQVDERIARGPVVGVEARAADSLERAARVLGGLGYAIARPGAGQLWAVKNRASLLGFVVFHLSFLVMAVGGLTLYYTRFVATLTLVEGQSTSGGYGEVLRRPPLGDPEPRPVALVAFRPEIEGGKIVDVVATVRLGDGPETAVSVNRPAVSGPTSLLVMQAGVAPVLWLKDAGGFTRDRVSVVIDVDGGVIPRVPVDGGRLEALVQPVLGAVRVPRPDALKEQSFVVSVSRAGEDARLTATLRAGGSMGLDDGAELTLESVRYWARFQVIDEKGGLALVLGFLLLVIGAAWRLLWYRREIALVRRGAELVATGSGEFFPNAFGEELAGVMQLIGDALGRESRGAGET
ncbi:MAG: cytochrome c biogenesis protein ResB [Deltaproteobacteria bacterium]|nr:cytochrome c biogenesis protein ResB [Deltaproteobacteria bacterium]